MANITITVQSLLNTALYDSYTIASTATVADLKTAIHTSKDFDTSWYSLVFNDQLLLASHTLTSYGIVDGSILRTANQIARLPTLQQRQTAKLDLAALDRYASGNPRAEYDISELPTQYSGNDIIDNPNPDGLIQGRPWIIGYEPPEAIGTLTFNEMDGGANDSGDLEDSTASFISNGFVLNNGATNGSAFVMRNITTENLEFFAGSAYNYGYVWTINWGAGSTYSSTPVALYFEGDFGANTMFCWILDPSDLTYSTPINSGTFKFPITFTEGTTPTTFQN